jgi:hypothetical protein
LAVPARPFPNRHPAVAEPTVTTHSQLIECDDALGRLRLPSFAAKGTYNFTRPMALEDVDDVLEADNGCILVLSSIDVPGHRVAAVKLPADRLTAYCEKNRYDEP